VVELRIVRIPLHDFPGESGRRRRASFLSDDQQKPEHAVDALSLLASKQRWCGSGAKLS
jgi:hypothetical protein